MRNCVGFLQIGSYIDEVYMGTHLNQVNRGAKGWIVQMYSNDGEH